MKKLIMLFSSFFIFGCNRNSHVNQEQEIKDKLANELIENDFLKYVEISKLNNVKKEILDSFYIYDEAIFRTVHVDAEELVEFNFDYFIPNLNEILNRRGLNLNIEKVSNEANSFEILINDYSLELYTEAEFNSSIFWQTGPKNFFNQVNEILKENSIHEKFYLLYQGNDLHVILLTTNQFAIISEYYKNNKKEVPYET